MTLQLTHVHHDRFIVTYNDHPLFHYVYQPDTPQLEAPRPYFHPLYTLDGDLMTNFRPHDHPWHRGISMTMAVLSGQNFWGGVTYVDGEGYVQLDNNGSQQHVGWDDIDDRTPDKLAWQHRLQWTTQAGETWIDEERRVILDASTAPDGYYSLTFRLRLTNVRGKPLEFSSPTVEGRPKAGYGGLFWRGPRAFSDAGHAFTTNDTVDNEIMGESTAWVAYTGKHDGTLRAATMLFQDHPGNPRYPNKWFVRVQPICAASFAFSYDEILTLPDGDTLDLNYRIVVGNGAWDRQRVETVIAAWNR